MKTKLREELRKIFAIQMIVKGIIFLITKLCFKLRRGNHSVENKANYMDTQIQWKANELMKTIKLL